MKKVFLKQLSLLCLIIAMAAIFKPVKAQQGNDSIGMGWYYEMYQSGGNFLDIKNRAEQFFATHPDYDTVAELKNQYLDWLRFNRDRAHWVDSAAAPGDLNSANKAMSKILSEKSYSNQTPYESDWKLKSADEYPTQNLGIITCTWQNPANALEILAGTEASGLWRTTNGGNTWVNITDSYFANDIPNTTPEKLPLGFGVSSIAVTYANNQQYIVISTYLPKNLGISSYAIGLIVTRDYGQTWKKVTHANIPFYNSDLVPVKLNCLKVIDAKFVNQFNYPAFYASFGEYIYQIFFDDFGNADFCNLVFDLHANINNVNYHIMDNQLPAIKNNISDMEYIVIGNDKFLFVSTDGFNTDNVKSDAKVFYCTSPTQIQPTLNTNWYYLDLFQSTANSFVDYIAIDSYLGDCFFAYNKQPLPIAYNNVETFYIDKYQKPTNALFPWFKPLGWDCSKTHQNNYTVGPILAGFGKRYNGFKVYDGSNILVGGYELNHIKNYNNPGFIDFSVFHATLNSNENYAKNNSYHYGIRTIEKFIENLIGTDGGISRIVWHDQNSSIASVNNINNKGLAISQINSMTTTKNSNHDIIINNAYRNGLWQYKCDKWDNYYWEDGGNILLDEIDRDLNDNGEPDYVHNFTANINWSFPMYPYIQQLNYCTFPNCVGTSGIYPAYINLTSQGAYSNNLESNYNTPMEFSNSTNDNVLHGLHNIYQSSDFGQTWLPLTANAVNNYPQPNYWSGSLEVIRVSQNNPNIMYIAFSNPTWSLDQNGTTAGSTYPLGKIYRGQKGQSGIWNWVDITAGISNLTPSDLGRVLKFTSITDIAINPFNSNEIWVSFNNYDGTDAITGKYRVLSYNYNTNVWTDYSDGLTAAPVNCIIINKYSNINEMFVGTDIGVFYRNRNMNKWELFHKSNPKWIVTDLSINYEKMLLRAATWGRSIWETPIKCIVNTPVDQPIYGYKVIDNPEINCGNITVYQGGTLVINANVEMAENTTLTVKRGGKLIIHNASIKSYCKIMWNGIVVEGDNTKSQTNWNNQGVVELIGASIEDAIIGIKFKDYNNANKGGGFLYATNSFFKNNQIAIQMQPYSYFIGNNIVDNKNSFTNCKFITDRPLYKTIADNNPKPISFVKVEGIHGLKFSGCNFENLNLVCGPNYEGIGIDSKLSNCIVKEICNSVNAPCAQNELIPSVFTGLNYGVKAIDYNSFVVKNTLFNANKKGLYFNKIENFYILSNKFYVPYSDYNLSVTNPDAKFYGAYLDNCYEKYHFENNYFSNIPNENAGFIGLYINNSDKPLKTIYNNVFESLVYGIIARGYNASNLNYEYDLGLKIKCNDFVSLGKDICVIKDSYNPLLINAFGISYNQGYFNPLNQNPTDPAGNTFDGSLLNIYNESNTVQYIRHIDPITNPSILVNNNNPPLAFYGNTIVNSTNIIFDKSTACPPRDIEIPNGNITTMPELPQLYVAISLANQLVNSATLIYKIWIDGGNTDALKQAVDLALPYEAYDLYNNLISKSPYLSDEVLIKAIENEEVLAPLMLKMVLLANPQAIKSPRIMNALYARNNPFPDLWIDELKQGGGAISPKEQLESEIDYAVSNYENIYNNIYAIYMYDTTSTIATDSLISLMQRQNRIETDIDLIYFYINHNMLNEAEVLRNSIPEKYTIDENMQRYWESTLDITQILLSLKANNKVLKEIGANDLEKLYTIYNGPLTSATAIARVLLLQADSSFRYNEPIEVPKAELEYKSMLIKENNQITVEKLEVYPNPANDFVTLKYQTNESLSGLRLIICDAMGKTVYNQTLSKANDYLLIILKDYAKGNYIASILNNQKTIKSCKFVVQ